MRKHTNQRHNYPHLRVEGRKESDTTKVSEWE